MTNTSQRNRITKHQTTTPANLLLDVLKNDAPTGTPPSPADIHSDLLKLLNYLKINLADQREGTSSFLASHAQALVYAERVATYAMQDYPRHVEGAPEITPLWDALHRIRRIVSAWRTGEHTSDGRTELAIIESIVQAALQANSGSPQVNAG
jgi:hypothetical protein